MTRDHAFIDPAFKTSRELREDQQMDRERERRIEEKIQEYLQSDADVGDIIASANLEVEIAQFFTNDGFLLVLEKYQTIRQRLLAKAREYAEDLVD